MTEICECHCLNYLLVGLGCCLCPPWWTRCWRILIALPPSLHLLKCLFLIPIDVVVHKVWGSLVFCFSFLFLLFLWFQTFLWFVLASLAIPFPNPFMAFFVRVFFSLGSSVSCILYTFRRTWFSCASASTCVSSWFSWLYYCQVVFVSVFVFELMI